MEEIFRLGVRYGKLGAHSKNLFVTAKVDNVDPSMIHRIALFRTSLEAQCFIPGTSTVGDYKNVLTTCEDQLFTLLQEIQLQSSMVCRYCNANRYLQQQRQPYYSEYPHQATATAGASSGAAAAAAAASSSRDSSPEPKYEPNSSYLQQHHSRRRAQTPHHPHPHQDPNIHSQEPEPEYANL